MRSREQSALRRFARLDALMVVALLPWAAGASDWPQFLGPTRNAVYAGTPLVDSWPSAGPAVVWRSAVGEGYSSPVLSEGRLIVAHRVGDELLVSSVGGTNSAGVVAFDRSTRDILWKALNEKACASSPVLAHVGGKSQLLVITRSSVHSLNPDTGSNCWSMPTRRQTSGNLYAASPVVFGDNIFIAGGYGLGAQLLRIEHGCLHQGAKGAGVP